MDQTRRRLFHVVTALLFVCQASLSQSQEVYLELDINNNRLPNNSIIDPNSVTDKKGILCCGATTRTWLYPNGTTVPSDQNTIIAVARGTCIELQLEMGLDFSQIRSQDEGVYQCNLQSGGEGQQSLLVGIYTTESYSSSSGPVPMTPHMLLSSFTAYPPSFTLHCPTTSYPPTSVTWRLNGMDLTGQSTQTLTDPLTSSYDNTLSIEDFTETGQLDISCSVRNARGSMSANRIVLAPTGPPTNLSVDTPGNSVVIVSWTPPQFVHNYTVSITAGEVTMETILRDPEATNATLTDITAGVEHVITVQAFADLPSAVSSPISITLQTVPAPTLMSVNTVSSTSIRVTWQLPPNAVVTGSKILYSPSSGQCEQIESGSQIVDGGTTTEYTLTGLQEGVQYEISMQARGTQAFGDVSNSLSGTTDIAAPSAPPSNISASPSSSSEPGITVRWSPPPCDHINSLSGLTRYLVQYRQQSNDGLWTVDNSISSASTTSTTITDGIAILIVYEFQVAAVNEAGPGVYSSSVTSSVVAATPPGSVTSLQATPDITSITITWGPPAVGEGRGLISGYRVCYGPASGSFNNCMILEGEATQSHRFSMLQIQSGYVLTVTALIDDVRGSTKEIMSTTNDIGQVEGVRVRMVDGDSVDVSWNKLDSMDVSEYHVLYSTGGGSKKRQSANIVRVGGNVSSARVNSLQLGASYSFQVLAVVVVNNVERLGPPSDVAPESMLAIPANSGVIAAIVIIVLVLIILVIIGVCAVCYYLWKRKQTGFFDVTARSTSIEMFKPNNSTPSRMPLPDFEKPLLAYSKPVIQNYPKDIIAEEGETVVFAPKVSGTPIPTIAWFFEGHMIASNYAFDVGEDGTLKFVCVEAKHAGAYRFTVSNSAGSVQGQVCLYVRGDKDTVDGGANGTGPPEVSSSSVPIEDFGEYIEGLHSNNNRGFRDQYYSLPSGEDGHDTTEAFLYNNKTLNRFNNIVAYNDNRVRLEPIEGRTDCLNEYINASYIDGYSTPKKFIATQGPTEKTLVDFWRMVWQTHAQMIIMITNLQEGTRVKCAQYWPEVKGQSSEYGPFTVTFSEEKEHADFSVRTFEIVMTGKGQSPLKISQFHYTSWPDHGVPDYVGPMLAFHRRIAADYRPNRGPVLIHCSAGVGRTGTYMAIDIALEQVEHENNIDIPGIITKIRSQRMKLVQTDEQYVFLHDAVFESLMCGSTQIPAWELTTTVDRLAHVSPHTQKSGFQHQFEILSKVTPKSSISCASAVQYAEKNRSMDHLPSEKYRVILKAEYPDYIHASFLNGYRRKKAFIVTQGPLESTCRDFWKMVYERNCTSIVMLSGLEENGMEVCYRYWPESGSSQYGEFVVGAIEQTMHDSYCERVLGVTDSKSGQTLRISQFQVSSWDTVGSSSTLPAQHSALLLVMDTVLSMQRKNGEGPIIVHCSDTVGRSCVFCAGSILTESCKAEGLTDVFQVVKALRVQKPGALPTVEQYEYLHNLLLTFLDSDNHSTGQL